MEKVVKATDKQTLKFESSDVQITLSNDGHINKLPFIATFMQIDSPSDGTPCGADFPVVITMDEAKKSVDTMNLMAVDCVWSDWWPEDCLTGHDARNKIGVIEKAYIEGNEMKMQGFIYKEDFPEIAYFIKNATPALGFSMECRADVEEKDGKDYLTNVMFTGVAILFQRLAAFENTYIDYIAASKRKKEEKILTDQEKREFMASIKEVVEETVKEKVSTLESKIDAKKNEADEGIKAELEKLKAEKADLEAKAKEEKEQLEAQAKEEREKLERKIADLEASRKSNGQKEKEGESGYGHVWDNGFDKGLSLMFSKMKEEVEGEQKVE